MGLEAILSVTNSLRHILLCVEHISVAQQTVTFEFLCAVCLLHEDSWKCVVSLALSLLRYIDFFQC